MGTFRYGTSSWTAAGWEKAFYPPGMRPAEYLGFYATRYGTVEADVTYYRVPDRRLVEGWDRKTPEGFLLSAKFPRSVVHGGEGPRPDPGRVLSREHAGEDVDRFLEAMGLLGRKCGPLVLQFPYFSAAAFRSPEPFLARLEGFLEGLPGGFRYAVEVRNRAWLAGPLLDTLRRHGAALVLADIASMPHPADLAGALDLATADFVYCRLIGDRHAVEAKAKSFEGLVLDQGPRLSRWEALLRSLLDRVPEVFAYANNHYAGYAPATIDALAAAVKSAG